MELRPLFPVYPILPQELLLLRQPRKVAALHCFRPELALCIPAEASSAAPLHHEHSTEKWYHSRRIGQEKRF